MRLFVCEILKTNFRIPNPEQTPLRSSIFEKHSNIKFNFELKIPEPIKIKITYGHGRLPEIPSLRRSRSDLCRLGPEPIGGRDGLLRADDDADDDVAAAENVGGDDISFVFCLGWSLFVGAGDWDFIGTTIIGCVLDD